MYNDEYNDNTEETEEVKSGSTLSNFYYNNKILIWIAGGILLFILIMSLLTKGGSNTKKENVEYKIILSPVEDVVVSVDASANVTATVENDPKAKVKWSIDDENIATIDGGNIVNIKGKSIGKARLVATYVDKNNNSISETKDIIVIEGEKDIKLTSVSFKDGDLFMPVYAKYKIAPVIVPSKGRIDSKEYTSSDEDVVTVNNNGEVEAVGEGEAIITLNVNNGEFEKELRVYVDKNQTKTEIVLTPNKLKFDRELIKIKVGQTHKLDYTIEPSDADTDKLIWTSSDEDIVTVDEDGRVKAKREGTASITVKSLNGQKDSIDVEVEKDIVEVTDISLSTGDVYLTVGQTQTITPSVSPDNASNKSLSYMPLDETIATARPNETGTQVTITGVSIGSTVIVISSTNNIEKRVTVTVTGSGSGNPGGNNGGNNGGGGSSNNNSSSQGYKISSQDVTGEGFINSKYEKTKPADNGATGPVAVNVTVTDSQVSRLDVLLCKYGTTCDSSTAQTYSIVGSGSFEINQIGEYMIKVIEYDANGSEIRTTYKYIWVKQMNGGGSSGNTGICNGYYYTCDQTLSKSKSNAEMLALASSVTVKFTVKNAQSINIIYTNMGTSAMYNKVNITSNWAHSFGNGTWKIEISYRDSQGQTVTDIGYISIGKCEITNCQTYATPRTVSSCYCQQCAPYYSSNDGGKTCTKMP